MFDMRQLITFDRLAKTGSFAQTARELFLTQSAISHSLRALESTVGCRLIDRSGKKMTLTEAGEALLVHAQRMISEMDAAKATIHSLNRWGFKRLRIACDALVARTLLAGCLAEMNRKNPSLLVEIAHCDASSAATLLLAESVDLAICEQPRAPGTLVFVPLIKSALFLTGKPGHPLLDPNNNPLDLLPKEPCVLSGKSTPSRQALERYCSTHRISLNPAAEVDDPETLRRLLIAGNGVGFLSPWMITEEIRSGNLAVRDLQSDSLLQEWGAVHRASRPLKPVEVELLQLLTAHAQTVAT
ncbi:MAG: hypothetical protein RLZZ399_1277 [Verrucomicrobiota bacterium]|jgi:DNA-binding transcriptional LysR family regulator